MCRHTKMLWLSLYSQPTVGAIHESTVVEVTEDAPSVPERGCNGKFRGVQIALSVTYGASSPVGRAFLVADSGVLKRAIRESPLRGDGMNGVATTSSWGVQIALSVTCGASSPEGRAFLVADLWGVQRGVEDAAPYGVAVADSGVHSVVKSRDNNGILLTIGVQNGILIV